MKSRTAVSAALAVVALSTAGCDSDIVHDPAAYESYEIVSAGTMLYEWGDESDPGWIKVLIEESNLGSKGAEIAEIYFPPGYQGEPHPHELEIIYVLEGELDHIVNGESHILTPGMIGVVRARDRVVHRTHSAEGVRTLIVWPLGNEVAGFSGSGMRETDLRK
ncbi:MAG: cupin domain-containing protein [Gammaproteobacteria bacterium]|nr:cupin domain-containing protein [Gammaproteobacteria bacterium]